MKIKKVTYIAGLIAGVGVNLYATVQCRAEENSHVTIHIFTTYTEELSDSGSAYFRQALEMAAEEFPDYTILAESADTETYKTRIRTMAASNEMPDIFFSWDSGFLEPFVNAGRVLPLDEYIDEDIRAEMKDEFLDEFCFEDRLYGIPSYRWVAVLYCNRELYEKYNLEYPSTFEELLKVCRVFRENGVTPMAVGMKDRWTGAQITNTFLVQLAGKEKALDMLSGEVEPDETILKQAAGATLKLSEAGAFPSNVLELTRDSAEDDFLSEKTAMEYMGTWVSEAIETSAVAEKIDAIPFPVLEGGDGSTFYGGNNGGLCVSSACAYPKETAEVALYLARQSAMLAGKMSCWEVSEKSGTKSNRLEQEIINFTQNGEMVGAWDTMLPAIAGEKWLELNVQLYGQKISADQFAKQLSLKLRETKSYEEME